MKKGNVMNILIELIGTVLYIFVLMPLYVVLSVLFMGLCVLALPLKIPAVERRVRRFLERKK